jgi:hypothetical protein
MSGNCSCDHRVGVSFSLGAASHKLNARSLSSQFFAELLQLVCAAGSECQ